MRWILLTLLSLGCVNPDPTWQRRTGGTLDVSISPTDLSGLVIEEEFDEGAPGVRVELWKEERLGARTAAERWARVVVQDVAVDGLNCADTADLTVWWESRERIVWMRLEPLGTNEVIEGFREGSNPQFDRYGFFSGDLTLEHPCIGDGQPTEHTYNIVWNLRQTDRGLQSPPPDQRQ